MSHVIHSGVPALLCGAVVLAVAWRSQAFAFSLVLLTLVGANSSFAQIKGWSLDGRWGAFVALGASALWTLPVRWPVRPPRRLSLALGSLVLLSLVSAAWSTDPRLTIERSVSFAAMLWTIFAVVRPALTDEAELQRLVAGIAAVTGVVAVTSVADWAVRTQHAVIASQLRGVFENPNGLGLMLGLCLPLLLAWAERRSGRLSFFLVAVSLLGVLALEFLAQARAGLVALLLGSIGYEMARGRLRRTLLPIGAALTVGLVFQLWHPVLVEPAPTPTPTPAPAPATATAPMSATAPAPAPATQPATNIPAERQRATLPTTTELLGGVGAQGESRLARLLGGRNEAWSQTVDLVAKRPIAGYGFGTGDRLLDTHKFVYFDGASPHNAYLQVLLELGVAGVLLIVLPLLLGLRSAAQLIAGGRASPEQAAFAGLLVAGLFNAVFEDVLTSAGAPFDPLIWLAAAVMLVRVRVTAPSPERFLAPTSAAAARS